MLQFKLPPYLGLGTHHSTTWKISPTTTFTNEATLLLNIERSTEFRDVLHANVSRPEDTIYYLQATRHDVDGNVLLVEAVLPISNTSDTTVQLTESLGVEKPTLKIVDNSLSAAIPSIKIKTSSIRPTGNGHSLTSWVFMDENERVIFKSINDEVNLKEFTLTEEHVDFSKYSKIIVRVSHVNIEGVSSMFTRFVFETLSDALPMLTNFRNINPDMGLALVIDPSSSIGEDSITGLRILSLEEDKVIYTLDSFNNETIIPPLVFDYNKSYILELDYLREEGNTTVIYKYITTFSKDEVFRSDVNYVYQNTLLPSLPLITEDLDLISPDGRFLDVLTNDIMIGISDDSRIYFLSFGNEVIVDSNTGLYLPFPVDGVNNAYRVLVLSSESFLLDIVDNNSVRHLVVFKHSYNFITLKTTFDIVVGTTTGLSPISYDYGTGLAYFLTNVEDVKSFKTLNIYTGEVLELEYIPEVVVAKEILCVYAPKKVMAMSDNSLFSFDTTLKLWNRVKTIPEVMKNINYFTIRRSDNSILFIPDNDTNIFLFDYKTSDIIDTGITLTALSRIYRTRDNSIFVKVENDITLFKYS